MTKLIVSMIQICCTEVIYGHLESALCAANALFGFILFIFFLINMFPFSNFA